MAVRGWGASIATAIGVAAGAGAAQLGLGYGLGIIAWLPSADGKSEAAWVASLAWAAWIAATSTVAGAICADRLSMPRTARSDGSTPSGAAAGSVGANSTALLATGLRRLALAVASALGGLVTVVLVAVPARTATRADTFSPQTIAAGYAVIGVMVGLLVAIWALSSPGVAKNVIATVGWLWLLAIVAVVDGVISGRGMAGAQLGVWQITSDSERFWFRNYFYWPGAALSLGSALLIGALAARTAARQPAARVGAAISGGVGPLLVAAAYFLAAPRLVGIQAEQVSAHLMAPYAVIAGLAGSVLVAAIAQRAEAVRGLALAKTDPSAPDALAELPAQRTADTGTSDADATGDGRATEDEPSALSPDDPGPRTTASGRSTGGRATGGRAASRRTGAAKPVAGRTTVVTSERPTSADDYRSGGDPLTENRPDAAEPGSADGSASTDLSASPDDSGSADLSASADDSASAARPKSRLGRLGRRSG
jgi:hypothetical protein